MTLAFSQARQFFDVLHSPPHRHTPLEDAQGLATGAVIAAFGIHILSVAGLITGGMAGLAFVLSYATGLRFGLLFFALNLPFYILSWRRLGPAFTIKTFLSVALTSVLAETLPSVVGFSHLDPLFASALGGLLLSFGLLALFRHRASLGGIGILAIYLQERFGWRAGLVQLAFDLTVLVSAFFVIPPATVLTSMLGAVILNIFLTINHRSDRYIAL